MSETCAQHPTVLAGFRCAGTCRAFLCGTCTAKSVSNQFFCCACGGTATQRTIARVDRASSYWITRALAYPVRAGLPLFAGAAIVLALVAFAARIIPSNPADLATPSRAIRGALFAIYMIIAIDLSARGTTRESGLPIRIARSIVATSLLWVPAVAYLIFVGAPRSGDPIWILFGALAAIYLPLALAACVTDLGFGDAANPFSIFALMWPLGWRFVRLIVTSAILGGIAFAIARGSSNHGVTAPVAGELVAVIPWLAVATILAHAIGLVPHVHGAAMRWASQEALSDPMYPRQLALGQRKLTEALTTESLTKNSGGSAGVSAAERNLVQKMVEHIKADEPGRALKIYTSRDWSPGVLNDRQLFSLGKAAAKAKQHDVALALYDLALATECKVVGQVQLAKAQVFAAKGDAAAARALYEDIVAKFPDTDVAKSARKALT